LYKKVVKVIRLSAKINQSKSRILELTILFKYKIVVKKVEEFKAWFPYGRKNRVPIFLNGPFIIIHSIPVNNHEYSLVIITPRSFSFKMLYFG
jgi:hypothetical protein